MRGQKLLDFIIWGRLLLDNLEGRDHLFIADLPGFFGLFLISLHVQPRLKTELG